MLPIVVIGDLCSIKLIEILPIRELAMAGMTFQGRWYISIFSVHFHFHKNFGIFNCDISMYFVRLEI